MAAARLQNVQQRLSPASGSRAEPSGPSGCAASRPDRGGATAGNLDRTPRGSQLGLLPPLLRPQRLGQPILSGGVVTSPLPGKQRARILPPLLRPQRLRKPILSGAVLTSLLPGKPKARRGSTCGTAAVCANSEGGKEAN